MRRPRLTAKSGCYWVGTSIIGLRAPDWSKGTILLQLIAWLLGRVHRWWWSWGPSHLGARMQGLRRR